MIHLLQASNEWVRVALEIIGAMAIFVAIFLAFYNRTRKQATVGISKTEGEVYKTIIENKLAEVNITEIIEKKVEQEVKPLKDMLWNREIEHYEVKKEMQERLMKEMDEKKVVMRENELLHNDIAIIRKEHDALQIQFNSLKKEVEKLKSNKNGN